MKFQDQRFSPELKKNLARLGFNRPTDIQFKCLKPILNGDDILAIAQTGTGKTGAFAIPLIDVLNERKKGFRKDGIKCLVMVPTHELAIQIYEVFLDLAKGTRVNITHIHGGVEQDPQIAALDAGVDVLIATPGRLFDLVSQKHLRLHRVETLVLDEADHMLERGFYKDIQDLIRFLPQKRQTLFFSATIDDKIKSLAYALVNKPVRIQISPKNPVNKRIDHALAKVEMDDKRFVLERLFRENEGTKMLVFVRTQVRAERVEAAMKRVEIEALSIHGGKEQGDRLEAMNAFKSGEVKMLIATDVSARGIDIPGVDMVINYDMPEQPENYVHRVGRTGRGTARGQAISFCSEDESMLLRRVEKYIGQSIRRLDVSNAEMEETRLLTQDPKSDLKALLQEDEEFEYLKKKRKGRSKNR